MSAKRETLRARLEETLMWCRDFKDGQFTPAHTRDGWTVEMHGLVSGLLDVFPLVLSLLDALAEVELTVERQREALREVLDVCTGWTARRDALEMLGAINDIATQAVAAVSGGESGEPKASLEND